MTKIKNKDPKNSRKALDYTIELWEWIVKTGSNSKANWPGWNNFKHGIPSHSCPLCEYALTRWNLSVRPSPFEGGRCKHCPLVILLGKDCWDLGFGTWSRTMSTRSAANFLKKLKLAKERLEERIG